MDGHVVENGIKMFFTPTIFDGENQMYCDNCDVKVDATRKRVIIHHPDVLLLMLKRFDFSYKHMSHIKINCDADVPHTLKVPENQTYELYAVVEHCVDLRGGHYKAIIRPKDEEVQWYVFDDTNVMPLGQNPFPDNVNIAISRDAYLLFYRKKDAISSATYSLSERTSMTACSDSVETGSASLFCAGAASGSSAVSTVNQGPGPEAPVAPHFQAQQCFGPWTANRRGSTSSSAADSNPSDTSGLCQDEPTAHASSNYTTHLSMMSNVSDLCSDDEEMNHAILASIETHLSETSSKSLPVKDILKELSKNINTGLHCKFDISRSAVLDGAIREFKRVSYNPHFSMNVKFSDDFGKNEEAVDLGGPRREFLRLLIEALSMSPMFEGPDKSKDLAMNSTALREDKYFIAGRAIAVSLVHGGPAPQFLSPVLFARLVGGPNAACPTLKDVTDADLHEKLKKVSESSTLEELLRATDPLLDYMTSAGCVRPLTTINDRDLLLYDLLMFHVVHRVQGAFQ
ncbi:hypothetical protein ILYODFUR_023056, partial [Ilyodon furcidens]